MSEACVCGFDPPNNPNPDCERCHLLTKIAKQQGLIRELLAVCESLTSAQAYFAENAREPEMMPGNQFYSDMFMIVVVAARDAIKHVKELM